jgi:hypothetical protein
MSLPDEDTHPICTAGCDETCVVGVGDAAYLDSYHDS